MPSASTSNPGAKEKDNCYCLACNFYNFDTERCTTCADKVFNCLGNFTSDGSHNRPISFEGYFMIDVDRAAECRVDLRIDAPHPRGPPGVFSACRGGGNFSAGEDCEPKQALAVCVFCGACCHLSPDSAMWHFSEV
eukprot:gnl/TRDRNA2_/TRDRNA2_195084_c0_seq1.p1 gnl/TRDRNA2_/TRDRNA2_195084_c0~~gnl/TRDRNA2_/TRDRNA2_195084_c0_seq1.p1  ORF type:complete len:136 (+),score=14.39 gnl/TRDRNA2_/TRDRNA2_195084_c0_seq1:83-490(+)